MRRKRLSISALVAGIILSFTALFASNPSKDISVQAEEPTRATTRRIYAVLRENWWHNQKKMYIHYWGGSDGSNWDNCPQMTLAVNDYWNGVYYFDVPSDTTHCLFKANPGGGGNNDQSKNLQLSNIFGSLQRVAWVERDPGNWDGNRNVGIGEASMSDMQFAGGILSRIDTCSNSYADGYNSYKQLMDCFVNCSNIPDSTIVYEVNGNETTVGEKLEAMRKLSEGIYYSSNAPILNASLIDINRNRHFILIFGGIGLASLAGYLVFKRKRKPIN
ncbi:MAG: hypothetical protein ACOX28_01060 [Bacilli bacterium]|jgi:hypothetical protein